MKIKIKFPRREIRGHRCVETTIYTVDWDHDSYTNRDRPLYRIVWKPVTLVDYDFQVARRLKGLGRMVVLAFVAAIGYPIAYLAAATGTWGDDDSLRKSLKRHLNDIVGGLT